MSEESEKRRLTASGMAAVAAAAVVALVLYFANPFDRQPRDYISLSIDTPYVGEGVSDGTPLIMHGVKVGHVSAVTNRAGGGVRIDALVRFASATGLTDTVGIDYRPSNYFGVTGINLLPNHGGQPLRSGARLTITPDGNFALQALLYRLGGLTHGVLNQRLIDVIERGTRYVDGLTPLLETMLIVAKAVADVQIVSTEQLLRNTAGVSVGAPGFVDALTRMVDHSLHTGLSDIKFAMGDPLYSHLVSTR
jgi:ABC-type transporter Mla subunit MlaD